MKGRLPNYAVAIGLFAFALLLFAAVLFWKWNLGGIANP
jgi:hypothetical protein